jgi:hypothetical protein
VGAAGALVVWRARGGALVAVLARGPRRSLPKVRVGAGEVSCEEAARHAAERWTGRDVRTGRALGVALVEADGQTLATAFHELHVVEEDARRRAEPSAARAAPLSSLEAEGWELTWLAPARAQLELSQREERLLVERAFSRRGAAALARLIAAELLPRERSERWLFVALAASALLSPVAAWLGWLAPEAWSYAHVPRVALAALLGGLTSAALRLAPDDDTPLLGAAAGCALGTLATTAVASGAWANVTLANPGALGVAYAAGFLERVLLRRRC